MRFAICHYIIFSSEPKASKEEKFWIKEAYELPEKQYGQYLNLSIQNAIAACGTINLYLLLVLVRVNCMPFST
jgi:hypothetical protein